MSAVRVPSPPPGPSQGSKQPLRVDSWSFVPPCHLLPSHAASQWVSGRGPQDWTGRCWIPKVKKVWVEEGQTKHGL